MAEQILGVIGPCRNLRSYQIQTDESRQSGGAAAGSLALGGRG